MWRNERTNSAWNMMVSKSLKAVINDNYGFFLKTMAIMG